MNVLGESDILINIGARGNPFSSMLLEATPILLLQTCKGINRESPEISRQPPFVVPPG